ncbi:MAG: ABC transporter substrate-binding protein [Patescibacteria group bacterium]|jgi:ABC-type transport system substrate-binding protein
MKRLTRSLRYSWWLVSGFIRKNLPIILIVFVIAFFGLFFSRAFANNLTYYFNFNKQKVGILAQGDASRMPLAVLKKVSSALVGYDEKGQLKPQLLKKWEVLDQGKKFVCTFPKNLIWADGTAFSVKDIDASVITFPNVKTTMPDDLTISFELHDPLVNFPSLLTTPVIKSNFVGIGGAYKIAHIKYEFGQIKSVNLQPLERGLPYLVYKLYNTQDEEVLAYKMGEIDMLVTDDKTVHDVFVSWKNTTIFESTDYEKMAVIFVNTAKAPLDNKNLRQAIAQLIDYSKFEAYGVRAYSPIFPYSFAYNADVKTYNYEPEIAQSLVEKNNAGGHKLRLYAPYELNQAAEVVSKDLKAAGFAPELRYANYIPTDYDLFLTLWEPPVDPDQYVFWHQTQKASNLSNFKNVKADKFLEDGRSELSQTKRKQIYIKFQDLLAEEEPAVYLYFPKQYTITRQ